MEKLTDCEQLVMKTVWDADEELSLMEIMQRVVQYITNSIKQKGVYIENAKN